MSSKRMPADDVLAPGQTIHLYPEGETRARIAKIFELQVDLLALTMNMTTEEYLTAPAAGASFSCAVTGDNCVYRFSTLFRSSTALPDKIWYMQLPMEVERQQNRRFVRVPAPLPMRVKYAGGHGSFSNASDTMMVDISGNGICFVSEKEAAVDTKVTVEVPGLPVIGTLRTQAVVKRCVSLEVPMGRIYHIGACLDSELTGRQQDKLIRSVFQLQRKYLERGMGI